MQKLREGGTDPETFEECAELARQVTVQKKLTGRIITQYETAFADPDTGEQIPEVVRKLQEAYQNKTKRLSELAGPALCNCIKALSANDH